MNPHYITLSTIFAATFATMPAMASTMPRADFQGSPVLAIGGGTGVGLSFDAPITPTFTLGAAIGSGFYSGAVADIRGLFRFWNQGRDPFTAAGLIGAQAAGPVFSKFNSFAPMLGVATAFKLQGPWTLRANLVVGLLGNDNLRPAGIEIAYRFHPRMEFTVGYNGRGDVLGLNLAI